MNCPNCGASAPDNSTFCASCGTNLQGGPAPGPEGSPPTQEQPGLSEGKRWAIISVAIVAAVIGLALVLGGGSGDTPTAVSDEEPVVTEPEPEPEVSATESIAGSAISPSPDTALATCLNLSIGYELSYPADWFTDFATRKQECRFFSPEPFEVARGDEPEVDIVIDSGDLSFDEWDEAFSDSSIGTIDSQTELTIGGRRAVVVDLSLKDQEISQVHAYVIEDGESSIQLFAVLETSADYEVAKQVLDAMALSIQFL